MAKSTKIHRVGSSDISEASKLGPALNQEPVEIIGKMGKYIRTTRS